MQTFRVFDPQKGEPVFDTDNLALAIHIAQQQPGLLVFGYGPYETGFIVFRS